MNSTELDNIFTYHAPIGNQAPRYEMIRSAARDFASVINSQCPESREKIVALTRIQEAVMMANAAIAIHE